MKSTTTLPYRKRTNNKLPHYNKTQVKTKPLTSCKPNQTCAVVFVKRQYKITFNAKPESTNTLVILK